jgi:hypothetical protein
VSRFEDRLWAELVEQHGALLADAPPLLAPQPLPVRRRLRLPAARRLAPLAGAAIALAAAISAIVIGFGSGGGSGAAFAVAIDRDGDVTITLRELAGVTGADERLQELGEPIRIIPAERGCAVKPGEYDLVRLSGAESRAIATIVPQRGVSTLLVRPAKIPHGVTAVFATRVLDTGPPEALGWAQSAYRGAVPPCETAAE